MLESSEQLIPLPMVHFAMLNAPYGMRRDVGCIEAEPKMHRSCRDVGLAFLLPPMP